MPPLSILELIGTFAFAAYGSYVAQRKQFDLFGIITCALVSSLGGGLLRELFMNQLPVFFFDYRYIAVVSAGILFALVTYKKFKKIESSILFVDAVGLVTFAFLGSARANDAHLGFLAVLFFATITAVGGGILRDIMIREVPEIFYQDFYATPALLLGAGYFALGDIIKEWPIAYGLLAIVFVIRILAIKYHLQLWKPQKS